MKPRLLIIYLILVLGPLGALLGIGLRLAGLEKEQARRRVQELLLQQLTVVDDSLQSLLNQRQVELLNQNESLPLQADALRNASRRSPLVEQYFLLDADQRLLYPRADQTLSADELKFLQRVVDVFDQKTLLAPDPDSQQDPQPIQDAGGKGKTLFSTRNASNYQVPVPQAAQQQARPRRAATGWYRWVSGRRLHLIFWERLEDGRLLGAELESIRFMADVIAALPQTNPLEVLPIPSRMVLCDSLDQTLYQWGPYEAPADAVPLTQLGLSEPLAGWSVKAYLPPETLQAQTSLTYITVISGFGVMALAVTLLAVLFYRESTREIRRAAQRISFVNQVSHELKTPLTNIRMYAELLENRIDPADEQTTRHLRIITSESCRLGRLITNILTFSRQQRNHLKLHRQPGKIDAMIQRVLEQYRESLDAYHLTVAFDAQAADDVLFDADVLEQILVNLISNAEKYAAEGGLLRISSTQANGETQITVADNGPGIPSQQQEKIFQPFHRLSDKITDGATGTGIGLSIARQLARLHGGDVTLQSSDSGAAFEITLQTPAAIPQPQTGP